MREEGEEKRKERKEKREKRKERREEKKENRTSPLSSLLSPLSSLFSLLSSLFSPLSFLFSLFFSLSLLLANPSKSPSVSPMQSVKELDQMADQYRVGKTLTPKDQEFNRDLKSRILRGTFNLRELARLALAKHWDQRSAKEQDRFVELLTQLLEERSVFAKEKAQEKGDAKSYIIDYKKEKYLNSEKTQASVFTRIRLKKHRTDVAIDYRLKKTPDGKWQIYDVSMDDASLVANYRASFGKIIEKNGYPELINRMEKKLKEFRAKRI